MQEEPVLGKVGLLGKEVPRRYQQFNFDCTIDESIRDLSLGRLG